MILRIAPAVVFVLCLSATESAAYSIAIIITGCEDKPHAVGAYNLHKGDDASQSLHEAAMQICPLGYERLETQVMNGGETIIWNIHCHEKQVLASNSPKACGTQH
jgi:hypothetical protein